MKGLEGLFDANKYKFTNQSQLEKNEKPTYPGYKHNPIGHSQVRVETVNPPQMPMTHEADAVLAATAAARREESTVYAWDFRIPSFGSRLQAGVARQKLKGAKLCDSDTRFLSLFDTNMNFASDDKSQRYMRKLVDAYL